MSPTVAAALLIALGGCEPLPTEDPNDLPDWSAGFDDVTGTTITDTTVTQPEPPRSEFNLSIPADVTWPAMLRRWEPATGEVFPDEPCSLDLTGVVGGQAVVENCILEHDELDLYMQGFSIDTHVPAGICDYLFTDFYMYEAWPIGPGPTTVSYSIDDNGAIVDEVNSFLGEPLCPYDFSASPNGPNCCTGSYTLSVTDLVTGQVTSGTGYWGGESDLGKCYDGGAYLYAGGGRTEDSFPINTFFFLDRGALDTSFTFNPENLNADENGDGYGTNIGLANYVDVTDHNGQPPLGMRSAPGVNPLYSFICTDNAAEKYGILNLTVREWNTEAEFQIDGNPDAQETEFETLDPFKPYDDVLDWRGMGQKGLDELYVMNGD